MTIKKVTFSTLPPTLYLIGNESRKNEFYIKSISWMANLERYHHIIEPAINNKLERIRLTKEK